MLFKAKWHIKFCRMCLKKRETQFAGLSGTAYEFRWIQQAQWWELLPTFLDQASTLQI